jgi:hypothetical protein
VRVGTDHHKTGGSVILEDNLVDDTGSCLPETNTVLGTSGGKEVVDLLVDVVGTSQVLDTTDLSLNQVVAVDRGGDGSLGKTGRHELENGHLGGSILARDTLSSQMPLRY